MKTKLIDARKVHARHMAESPEYRAEYEGLEEGFALVNSMIRARTRPAERTAFPWLLGR